MNDKRLPSGTVSFLFTDIEGSTKLWQLDPEAMRKALARHHEILHQAIEASGGYVFQIIGDAFCAAFDKAPEMLAASLAVQRLLRDEQWANLPPIRVRIALHTGAADVRPSDYTAGEYVSGLTLSRTARLLSAGHGGQILLSTSAYELVRDDLPTGITLTDMGAQRLKDMVRPEKIYQVVAPDLQADFPPLKTVDSLPNNLPIQLASFIGREREISEIKEIMSQARLVTVTGPGGCGKTRLALQIAADLLEEFADGVWFVDLSTVSDPSFVPYAISGALDVREVGGRPVMSLLTDYLRHRELLLVPDNCEHLLEACAHTFHQLLQSAPGLRILATSREGLDVAGERIFSVPSLSLPDSHHPPPAEILTQYEAVRLFIERARDVKNDFTVTNSNAPAVAQICHRLDGIPLAIELAAVRVKALSVEQIASRLADSFRLLTEGRRTSLPRQQTLRALIDWSWDLLTEPECKVLKRLAVFSSGWTLDAAEQVCAGEGIESSDIFDLLAQLVNKSLVTAGQEQGGERRYRLLETIRQYAREKWMETGNERATRDKHLRYFLRVAETAEVELHRRNQKEWLARLETEHDNFRSGLEWAIASQPEAALSLCSRLGEFWDIRGYLNEGYQWTRRVLESGEHLPPSPAYLKVMNHAAMFAVRQYNLEQYQAFVEKGLELARQIGDRRGEAVALNAFGILKEHIQGRPDEAYAFYTDSLRLWREVGDPLGIGQALGPHAAHALRQGNYAEAERIFNESLSLFKQLGDQREIAGALWNLAEVALAQSDLARVKAYASESLAIYRDLEDKHGIATALRTRGRAAFDPVDTTQLEAVFEESCQIFRELHDLGCLALTLGSGGRAILAAGNLDQAQKMIWEGLALMKETSDPQPVACLLEGSAEVLFKLRRWVDSAGLFAAAETYREFINMPLTVGEQARHDQMLVAITTQLDQEAFTHAWSEGKGMTADQAVGYALRLMKVDLA